jgi:hypothetical protein
VSVVIRAFVRIAHDITNATTYFIKFTTKKLRFLNKNVVNRTTEETCLEGTATDYAPSKRRNSKNNEIAGLAATTLDRAVQVSSRTTAQLRPLFIASALLAPDSRLRKILT